MIRKYWLAVKYFIQGDDWASAVIYAEYITAWTQNRERQIRKVRGTK